MDDQLVADKLEAVTSRAKELLNEHELDGWGVTFNYSRDTVAVASHKNKTISYSKYFVVSAGKEEFDGVTLHEITHALLGPGKGHNYEFRKLCRKISRTDKYARASIPTHIRKYTLTCDTCGYSGTHNKKIQVYCKRCFSQGIISKLRIEPNNTKLVRW